jgi:hypothetical protein
MKTHIALAAISLLFVATPVFPENLKLDALRFELVQ